VESGELALEREKMIERHLKGRGITNLKILSVFKKIPREQFLPPELKEKAYEDHPLPIGEEQTISQPYIVAFMTELLQPEPKDRVLEIGTGSGYQTAVLAELVQEVYSIEVIKTLHESAKLCLQNMGYQNVFLKYGEGQKGWPSFQPFDKIIAAAAAEEIPSRLVEQLKEGGRIVIPVGFWEQDLILGRKEHGVLVTKPLMAVRFVPMRKRIS
jgi:protein-L-isoaspartate(D-aspartate) O-methyltransferase